MGPGRRWNHSGRSPKLRGVDTVPTRDGVPSYLFLNDNAVCYKRQENELDSRSRKVSSRVLVAHRISLIASVLTWDGEWQCKFTCKPDYYPTHTTQAIY